MSVEIVEVTSKSEMKSFISVPWEIYRDDPNWVPPLKFERSQAFSPKNPFFKHARWKAWIARVDGKPVGRISAQIDDLFLQVHDPDTGFFGLIESIDDQAVFDALFATAAHWLKEQGMTRMLGPFNLGINQEIGCLVDGFDSPPFFMMGHARRYYGPMIENAGFTEAKNVLAYNIHPDRFALPGTIKRLLQRQGEHLSVRQVDRKRTTEELALLRDIFNDAWSNNWGFVPFTEEEFMTIGKELFMIVPKEFSVIAEADGEPAAFLVMLPNLNEAIADLNGRLLPFGWARFLWRLKVKHVKTARILLMGVRKKYQDTLLGPALAFIAIQSVHGPGTAYGLEDVEMSWILEDNQAMRNIIEKVGGHVTKTYRMYEKSLL